MRLEVRTICSILKRRKQSCIRRSRWNREAAKEGRTIRTQERSARRWGVEGNHGFGYHLYLICDDIEMKDTSAYTNSMQRSVYDQREVHPGDVGTSYMLVEKEGADDDMSRNTVTVEMIEEVDENSTLDVWSDYSVNAPIEED